MSPRGIQAIGLALFLLAHLLGCAGETPVEPPAQPPVEPPAEGASNELTPAEAQAISDEFVVVTVAGLNWGLTVATGSSIAALGFLKPDPYQINVLIDRSHSCEGGGTITASGALSGIIDPGNRRFSLTLDKSESIGDCRARQSSITFRPDAGRDLSVSGHFSREGVTRSGSFTLAGGFAWEADDGRSGRCEMELIGRWLTHSDWSIRGEVCGHEVSADT